MEKLEKMNKQTHHYGVNLKRDSVGKVKSLQNLKLKKSDKLNKRENLAKSTKGLYIESLKTSKVSDINTLIRIKKLVERSKREEEAKNGIESTTEYLKERMTIKRVARRSRRGVSRIASMKELRNIMA